jgi:hypothetical protein
VSGANRTESVPKPMAGGNQAMEYRPYFENYTVDASIFDAESLRVIRVIRS